MQHIVEELQLVQSMVIGGEFEWLFDEEEDIMSWKKALEEDSGAASDTLKLPEFSLRLARGVDLVVTFRELNESPHVELHAPSIPRNRQAGLVDSLHSEEQRIRDDQEQHPVFALYNALLEQLATNPLPEEPPQKPSTETADEQSRRELKLKVVLIWSHHLLATSKRKNIVQWSTELQLWGLSKPGYPGVFIVEGLAADVDEFVWRIKQLNWKALQVRCELDGPVLIAPPEIKPEYEVDWALRKQTHLGPVLCEGPQDKISVREVEGLNEVGEIMARANLEDVFKTALKI